MSFIILRPAAPNAEAMINCRLFGPVAHLRCGDKLFRFADEKLEK